MGLSKLPQKRTDGVSFIEQRSNLYYNKFLYRARIYIKDVNITYYCDNSEDIQKRLTQSKNRWKNCDVQKCIEFLEWKKSLPANDKSFSIRIEGSVAAVFSSSLQFLNDLESKGWEIDITEVDSTIPEGVKYFVAEPKYKYRIHFRTKRINEDTYKKLLGFLDRYKNTSTVIVPSRALNQWLKPDPKRTWKHHFLSSNYFINYNDESVLSLFMLIFDGMVSKKYKLEKRPN